jgi:motility quorum-sensing regulator/GCU-specific mRNA interferase toxin
MEKKMPHCRLSKVHTLVRAGQLRTTQSALAGAAVLGLGVADMVEIVLTLTAKDFFKSMTTYADHTIWQDVYRPATKVGPVYLKLTVVDDVLIVSFKEL